MCVFLCVCRCLSLCMCVAVCVWRGGGVRHVGPWALVHLSSQDESQDEAGCSVECRCRSRGG